MTRNRNRRLADLAGRVPRQAAVQRALALIARLEDLGVAAPPRCYSLDRPFDRAEGVR